MCCIIYLILVYVISCHNAQDTQSIKQSVFYHVSVHKTLKGSLL